MVFVSAFLHTTYCLLHATFMLHTSGFVLRKNDYREYDRIYTVYTSDFGKMSLLVRGAKKIKSKLAPAMENFDKIRIDFAKGKVFNHLSGSAAGAANKNILRDAEAIALSLDCLYLLDRFIKPEESDARIFNLINEALRMIACSSLWRREAGRDFENKIPFNPLFSKGEEMQKIKIYFFWKLVEHLGYGPRLEECALCGTESRIKNQELWFNITDNILICKNCAGAGILINDSTLENLRKIFTAGFMEFLKINLDAQLSGITEKARQIKLSEL